MRVKPIIMTIDISTLCQLSCPRCPVTTMGYVSHIKNGYMNFENFKKIIDQNPGVLRIDLDNFGELFLNPDLAAIIEYAYRKKISLTCSVGVNLNNASKEALEALVKYRFLNLTCSIDGATNETYNIYRAGGDINKVIENIKIINSFKKMYNSRFPRLKWQFIVFGHNEHEIVSAKKIAKGLGMNFFPKLSWDSGYSPIKNKDFVLSQTGWLAATREEYEGITGRSFDRNTCYSLWHSPRINFDGSVSGCCWNVWSEFGGNVFSGSYSDAVNSEKINYAKKMLMGEVGARKDVPCAECGIYLKIARERKFLTYNEIHRAYPWYYYLLRNYVNSCGAGYLGKMKLNMVKAVVWQFS